MLTRRHSVQANATALAGPGMGRLVAQQRLSQEELLRNGAAIEAAKTYSVAGWASVNEGTQGPPVWDLVTRHIAAQKTVRLTENRSVTVVNP